MSDPYRTAGTVECPKCRSSMRAFGERLVCDACTGILIPLPELEKAVSKGAVTVTDGAASKDRACPRCATPFVTTRLTFDEVSAMSQHCHAHGVWFDSSEELQEFFRKFPPGGTHGGAYGGGGYGVNSHGHMTMYGHAQTFVADSGGAGLSIQHWWERRHPRQHTVYKTPYGETTLACPGCGDQLALSSERWSCSNCGGAFVDNQPLVEMMMEMAHAGWQPPALQGTPSRPCPVCKEKMLAGKLEAVPVERCGTHGVWFGPDALRAALLHAAGV